MNVIRIVLCTLAMVACAQTPITIPTPPQLIRREVVDRFPLPVSAPVSQTTATFTLGNTPEAGTLLRIHFRSSQTGGDFFDAVVPIGPNTRELVVTLPGYRPFTPTDVLTVMYWTREP